MMRDSSRDTAACRRLHIIEEPLQLGFVVQNNALAAVEAVDPFLQLVPEVLLPSVALSPRATASSSMQSSNAYAPEASPSWIS